MKKVNTKVAAVIVEFNKVVKTTQNSYKSLLVLFRKVYEMGSDEYQEFKEGIDLERSTINKLDKICRKTVIYDNIKSLPITWSVLYEIVKLEPEQILAAIEANKLTPRTTKKEVLELRASLASASADKTVSSTDVTNDYATLFGSVTVDLRIDSIPEKDKKKVAEALEWLNKYYDILEFDAEPSEEQEAA